MKQFLFLHIFLCRYGSLPAGCTAGCPALTHPDTDSDSRRPGDILRPGQDVQRADEPHHHHHPVSHPQPKDINIAARENTWHGEGRLLWLQGFKKTRIIN